MQNTNNTEARCKRCGECCRNGGPALHKDDMALIESGEIPLTAIVAIRPGERAYDQIAHSVKPLNEEILKIKGRDGAWTCLMYSPEGRTCGMYDTRPIECEKLFCEEPGPLAEMYDKDRLKRTDVLPEGHPLLELITEHDTKCSPLEMEELGKKAREGDAEAGKALQEMVLFDMEMRRLVVEKAGMAPEMNEFLFGRPLRVLLRTMNIKVYEVDGSVRFDFTLGA